MALFPAFAESADTGTADRDLDWLRNESFHTQDALSLHQRSLEAPPPSPIFRSRPPPGSQSPASEEERSEVTRKKKKKKKHKEPKKRGRGSDDSAPQTRSPDPAIREPPLPSPCSVWLEEAPPPAEVMYRIDKKADSANWEYKCLYRGDIARYRRRGGSCLGIDPRTQRIIWGDPPEKKSAHKKPERYYSRSAVQALRMGAEPVECGVVAMDAATIGFIPVTDPSSNPVTNWLNPLGIYDQSTSMWLQGKGGPQEPSPPTPHRHSQIQAKVEEYNRRIRENPTHIQTWIDFISFQDELLAEAGVGEMQGCRASLLEKKLCIVDRAIAGNAGSVELKLARLGICSELWEASALMKEWQKLIFLHPNDPQLWQKYLLFSQSHFTTFSVSRVHATYAKCLTTLSAIQDGSMTSHPALPGTERAMYEIFLQQCHFLRQAGQCEKSVSLFQAIIDFTFYKPESVTDMTTRGQVEFFEPFWDSAEPRFGENGAKGWSLWMRQQERGGWVSVHNLGEEEEEEGEEDLDIKDKHLPHHEIWLDMERSRESRHWVPWRPDPDRKQTEEECEDPERQVLFDDLGSSMFRITGPALRFQLMLSFLRFLGVPCGPRPPPASLYLAMDEDSLFECTAANGRLVTTLQAPLAGVSRVGHLTVMSGGRQQIDHCKEGERFIQNVFQSALSLFHGEEKTQLCVCWLQYEVSKVARCFQAQRKKQLKSQGKRSKRLARSLLKEPLNRNSLALWAEFALLEWLLGNMEEARKVFDTAIGLAGGKGLKDGELCSLCLLYAELEGGIIDSLEGGGGSRAIHVLASLADSSPYKPYHGPVQAINILKAAKAYERALQDAMKLAPSPWLVTLCGCRALFQYLTLGIDAAVAVFNEVAGSLPPPACEEGSHDSDAPLLAVTLMQISLLSHHGRVSVYPRAPLRDALSRAIRLFPDDVTLWRSYIQTESRCHHISRVRRFMDEMRRSGRVLETYLFTIHCEEKRNRLQQEIHRSDSGEELIFIPETGLSNRIKALYERAVATEHGRRCVLLWRMYLHFMFSQGRGDRGRGLFYKAIQSCPWAKVLYMDGVGYFPDKLQEIVDLMTEKELRVRFPLEELDLLLED